MKRLVIALALLFLATSVSAGDLVVDTVSYTPAPAIPGDYFNLYIHLKNNSKYLSENVTFELDLSGGTERADDYPFFLGTGVSNVKEIPTINAKKTALIEYRIGVDPTALDGDYTLVFKFYENDAKKEYSYTIKVLSRKPDIEIVKASQVEAAPGQTIDLELTLRNVGSGLARDILAGIEESRTVTATGVVVEREFSALGSSFAFVKQLAPGDETRIRISLAVNPEAEQKAYTIPITLNYKDTNATAYSDTSYIGLKVSQDPQIDAVISEVTPIAFPGGKSEVTIDLFNIGIGTAKYVVAELSTASGSFEQDKEFIGTLEADDFDSFKVDLTLNPTADPNQEHTVILTLNYKNQYGEDRNLQKPLQLKVHSAAEIQAVAGAFNPVLIVFSLFMLAMQLLGLYVFFYKWLYKKKIKKGQ